VTAQTSCSSIYDYDRGFKVFEDWIGEDNEESSNRLSRVKSQIANGIEATPILSSVMSELKFRYDGLNDLYNTPPCPYPHAETVTDTALSLAEQYLDPAEDFFIWIHYMEPHAPYYPPTEYSKKFHDGNFDIGRIRRVVRKARRARPEIIDGSMINAVSKTEIKALRDFYAAATRYVDDEVNRLVEQFESIGLLEDTVMLFTADHGEELFDRGTLGHRTKMYEELVHVPFIIYDRYGHYTETTDIDSVTSHLDIAPTITEFYDVDAPEKWRGVSLIDLLTGNKQSIDRDNVISELCHTSGLGGDVTLETLVTTLRSERWKYIQNRQLQTEELYDLQADPLEEHDIATERDDVVAEMKERLNTRLANVSAKTTSVELTGKVQSQLKELGYID